MWRTCNLMLAAAYGNPHKSAGDVMRRAALKLVARQTLAAYGVGKYPTNYLKIIATVSPITPAASHP
jgi:hypothetical protein